LSFQSNRQLLAAMAARLKRLLPEVVFVGGCTTGLLITDPAASPVRATDDVDVIVEVASYAEYARFSKRPSQPRLFRRLIGGCTNLPMADRPHET